MPAKKLAKKAEKLLEAFQKKDITLATAESCTGGLIAMVLTELVGASKMLDRGFVTYSNASKVEMLGVPPRLIKEYGAVSAEVAESMAWGALRNSHADIAVSVTGIAGPGGGSKKKPVGLVYIAVASRHYKDAVVVKNHFKGDRGAVRLKSADKAFSILRKLDAFF